ncbi:transcriptional regulator [Nocardiopsis sp. CC223A]|uniref:transcriptional regulator n=1 Tax=Nocardiopsis sp. CC223A TaxID=3044051 RepID=UPI00278BB088|nr:transcriptional regulator [Nocardiopsis sp. CC223A]
MSDEPLTDDVDAFPREGESMEIDASALRGLTHPLRGRLLEELTRNGPATATILGRRLGESSGATSYHLRQLSRFGFIDAAPGRSGGRERWWRIRPGGWNMKGHEFLADPSTRAAAEIVLDRYYHQREEHFRDWLELVREHPDGPDARRWKNSASDSLSHMRMTPGETEEFAAALNGFIRDYGQRFEGRTPESHPDTETVEVQVNVFPTLPPPREREERAGDA